MAFKVEMLEEAKEDYYEINGWYQNGQSGLGTRFYHLMNELFQKPELHPLHYSYYFKPYGHTILKGFSCRVVFKVAEKKVLVNAIFHTSRNPKELHKQLK